MRKGLLILISGPSGTGKGTVCDLLRQKHPEISYSISATTRQPRPGEQDGVNYYFYTKEKFREMIDQGQLLEWAEVYGNSPASSILSSPSRAFTKVSQADISSTLFQSLV